MTFNSKSVIMNRGVNLRLGVTIPTSLGRYSIPVDLWDASVKEFNNVLDKRRQVKEIIDGIEVDVLRLVLSGRSFFIWTFAKENDVAAIEGQLMFSFRGKLVYVDEKSDKIEKILIEDLLYRRNLIEPWKSVFRNSK